MKTLIVKMSSTRLLPARRFCLLFLVGLTASLATSPVRAQISPESDKLLYRLFASTDFEVKTFGPAKWLDGGEFYTTVEPSASVHEKGVKDIVRYETSSGKRE